MPGALRSGVAMGQARTLRGPTGRRSAGEQDQVREADRRTGGDRHPARVGARRDTAVRSGSGVRRDTVVRLGSAVRLAGVPHHDTGPHHGSGVHCGSAAHPARGSTAVRWPTTVRGSAAERRRVGRRLERPRVTSRSSIGTVWPARLRRAPIGGVEGSTWWPAVHRAVRPRGAGRTPRTTCRVARSWWTPRPSLGRRAIPAAAPPRSVGDPSILAVVAVAGVRAWPDRVRARPARGAATRSRTGRSGPAGLSGGLRRRPSNLRGCLGLGLPGRRAALARWLRVGGIRPVVIRMCSISHDRPPRSCANAARRACPRPSRRALRARRAIDRTRRNRVPPAQTIVLRAGLPLPARAPPRYRAGSPGPDRGRGAPRASVQRRPSTGPAARCVG